MINIPAYDITVTPNKATEWKSIITPLMMGNHEMGKREPI